MNSSSTILQATKASVFKTADDFARGCNMDRVKEDWEKNKKKIVLAFFKASLLTALAISALIFALAALAAPLLATLLIGGTIAGWPWITKSKSQLTCDDTAPRAQISEDARFESTTYKPLNPPPTDLN